MNDIKQRLESESVKNRLAEVLKCPHEVRNDTLMSLISHALAVIEQQDQKIEQLTGANELLRGKLTPQQWLPSGSDIEAFQPNEAK